MTTQDKLATANFQLMKADIHIQTMTTEADQLRAEVARLTAGSESMQEDARNNTATIKAQAEEIRKMKQALTETLVALQAWQAIHPDDWDSGDKNAVAMAEKALAGNK